MESKVLPAQRLEDDLRYAVELAELGDSALEPSLEQECSRLEACLSSLSEPKASPDDDKVTFMTISAGAGGHEACAWVAMLLRMYYKHARRNGLEMDMIDNDPYLPDGLRSVTVRVEGKGAYRLFSKEAGVHKLSRVSPYDQADRRQTSRALVDVEPEAEAVEDCEVTIEDDELEVVAICGGGKGGQNVNRRHTTVVAKHKPTGLTVRCQNERSQEANKKVALELLAAKVQRKKDMEVAKLDEARRASLPKADFGEQSVRTYVLSQHPMVKDHRTGKQVLDVDAVMNGVLDGLLG